jgi:hypothetical protein
MEKSLYFEAVQKYFPQLVISVVEKLNEKNQRTLPYLYKDLLTKSYSADGRWASLLTNYTRVAADVVALDSELPLKSRDAIEKVTGDIPKIGMKLYLTEKQMKDIDTMIAIGLPENEIIAKIFADTSRVIAGVQERIEDIFLSELSTGVGLATANDGLGVRINMNYYEDHQFAATAHTWSEATATPISDIQKVLDKADEDGNVITDIWMDETALRAFYANKEAREQYAFIQNFVGQSIPNLGFDQAKAVLESKFNLTLHRVNRKTKTEVNGVKTNHAAWADGMVVFTCEEKVGKLVWTSCAELTRPVAGVAYETAEDFILVSKYSTNDPLREFTSSQAMVIPVLDNVDKIYTLNSKQVAA